MALSTLRLRETQLSHSRQLPKPARPSPQDLNEVLSLSRNLRTLKVSEAPDFFAKKPVLPQISPGVKFTDVDTPALDAELESVCAAIDESSIIRFLQKSQIKLNVLVHWWWDDINSLQFLNWWFTKFSYEMRCDWFKLECSILLEEISAVIKTTVPNRKVMEFLLKILHEHSDRFCDEDEGSCLPNMIEVLVSNDKNRYCALLSDVKMKSAKQERILALRSHFIISLCYAATKFYKKLQTEGVHDKTRPVSRGGRVTSSSLTREPSRVMTAGMMMSRERTIDIPVISPAGSRPTTAQNTARLEQHNIKRAFDCVSCGYGVVLGYLFEQGHITTEICDDQGRSMVFVAVLHKQHSILNNLIEAGANVNQVADNGNTPLHVAASAGNSIALNILLKGGADPRLFNPESNGATPLHLAVLSDSLDCVVLLLGAGADPLSKMGCPADTSVVDLAQQLGNSDIVRLLIGAMPVRPDSALCTEGGYSME